jgi:hypothetical protein
MRGKNAEWPRRRRAPTVADVVLVGVLAAALPILAGRPNRATGDLRAVVRAADGREQLYDLRQDRDLEIPGPAGITLLRIQDGAVWVARAPCARHLCQRMGRLRRPGRSIVCIPNHLVVRVIGDSADVDAVTR